MLLNITNSIFVIHTVKKIKRIRIKPMIEKKEMKLSEKMEFGQAKEFENILYSVVLALEKHINVYGNIEDRTMNEKDKGVQLICKELYDVIRLGFDEADKRAIKALKL
jgi:hypothetical protein